MCRRTDIHDKVMANVVVQFTGFYLNEKPSPCYIWQGSDSGNGRGGGYPRMCLSGHTVAVHRVMYTQVHGYIPGKKQIDHKCRNRMCVNPDHLEMVTHKQNQRRRDNARFYNSSDDHTGNPVGLFVCGSRNADSKF